MTAITRTLHARSTAQATADVWVPAATPSFEGHFPGGPVLPAVTQLHDVVLPAVREAWPDLSGLRRATRLKFRRPVGVDTALTLRMERRGDTVTFSLDHRGEPVSLGTLAFAQEPP